MPDISTVQLLILGRVEPGLSVSMRMFWVPWIVVIFTSDMIVRGQLYSFPQGYRNYRTWGTGPQRQAKIVDQTKSMEGAISFCVQFFFKLESTIGEYPHAPLVL